MGVITSMTQIQPFAYYRLLACHAADSAHVNPEGEGNPENSEPAVTGELTQDNVRVAMLRTTDQKERPRS